MVPVPVPEKIGPGKKYRYRYRKNLVPKKSTGPGTGKKSGYRHTLPRLSKNDDIGQHIVHNANGGTYLLFECHLFHLRINMQKCKMQTRKQYKSLPLRTLVKVYNFQAVNI